MNRSKEKAKFILEGCPHCGFSFKAGDHHDYKGVSVCQAGVQLRKTWHRIADAGIVLLIMGAIIGGLYWISKHGI